MNIQIKFTHNQMGMLVEARQFPTDPWLVVDLYRYTEFLRANFSKAGYTTYISPMKQQEGYLKFLDKLKITYEVIKEEE